MPKSKRYQPRLPWKNLPIDKATPYRPDDRAGTVYLEDEQLRFVAEIAIVTQRPLLLRGEPGSGKSSFAPFVARNLNWRYYEHTVTGRTEARDLLWRFDALRRLRDSGSGAGKAEDLEPARYVTPGPLWWAFNRAEALQAVERAHPDQAKESAQSFEPFSDLNRHRDPRRAVVLIDEIDKADPNVPNDLLDVLGSNRFRVDEADLFVSRQSEPEKPGVEAGKLSGSLLTVITTNEERDLPAAFLRRCIMYTIREPADDAGKRSRLVEIARLHMSHAVSARPDGEAMLEAVAGKCVELRKDAESRQQRGPSIAEFLDAVRFCLDRGLGPEDELWQVVQSSVLLKERESALEP